jgi:hypothetical protein
VSWLYSRALVEAFSEATCSAGALSAQWSATPMPPGFYAPAKTMAGLNRSLSGQMFAPSTADRGEELLTWFRVDSRAKTSASPARGLALMASALDSGARWRALLATFDPGTCSWRTAQSSLFGASGELFQTWPRSGMAANGQCWELPTLGPGTSENGFGLLPTPVADDTGSRKKPYAQGGTPLSLAVKLMPTPTAGADCLGAFGGSNARKTMAALVDESELYGPLNPTWVEWLMGWPTEWTALGASGTGKSPSVPQSLGSALQAA